MTAINWLYFVAILFCAFAGGLVPFTRKRVVQTAEFPRGESFSSGVFLALALFMMLPSAFSAFRRELPNVEYPVASIVAIAAFLVLLFLEHLTNHLLDDSQSDSGENGTPSVIPVALTAIIAMPSFFLGASLGMSDRIAGFLIFIAVILHKGTAAFALAMAMVRSTLTRVQGICLLTCFAFMTPLGILAGGLTGEYLSGNAQLIKAIVLSLGAGTFLYMGTLHELRQTPLIKHCGKLSCFLWMLAGLVITGFVRWMVGEAHSF